MFALGAVASASADERIPSTPYDLQECYQLALTTSERLKRNENDIRIAESQYQQILSSIYPYVSIGAVQQYRDNADFGRRNVGGTSVEDGASESGGRSGSLGKNQFDAVISVSQPLFTGFREFLLSDANLQETKALRFDLQRNRELLYEDVAQLYYQVLRADRDLEVLGRSEETIQNRVKELERFRSLGKSRDSEVLAAKADIEDFRASKERTLGELRATKELLAFLTGIPAHSLDLELQNTVPTIGPVEDYLKAVQSRTDVQASQLRVAAQQLRLEATKRGKWPTLDLVGNAYPIEDPDRNREWDLLFRLSVPVFDGGLTASQTAEDQARLQSADLFLQEVRRSVERDIRSSYERTRAGELEHNRLKKLLEASRRNYESQRRDYEFGVVSNIEVLQAIRQLQEAERRLVIAAYSYLNNLSALQVAAGGIPE